MSKHDVFASIDLSQLATVVGGQAVKVEGHAKVGDTEAGGSVDRTGTPERRSNYTTCLNDMGGGGGRGWFESRSGYNARYNNAVNACSGLKGSPKNPE